MDFNHTTDTISPDIGTNITVSATGALILPVGTTAQRPGSPSDGMLRYNTDEHILEGYTTPYNVITTPDVIQRTAIYRKRRYYAEEFLVTTTAINSVALYGELGWTQTSSGTSVNSIQTGVADHLGILRIGTGTTSTNSARIHLGNAANTGIVMANQVGYFAFIFRIPTITTVTVNLGLTQDASNTTTGTDGVFFVFNPATNAAMQFITRASSTNATAVNTVTIVANTWYFCEAFYNGTTWTPIVNGVTYTAQTTNIPTAAVNVAAIVFTGTTATRQLDLDAFYMITTELGTRY